VAIDTAINSPVVNNNAVTVVGTVDFNGLVSGPGDFFGPGTANFNGGMAPGASPAAASFEGNVSLGSNNTLFMEIGGTAAGTQYDQINGSGQLTLGGALQVSLISGFIPSAGQEFNILDWGSLAGTFSSLNLPTLAGLTWNTSQLYTTGVLSLDAAGVPGDYNNDGTVDAADYVVWRKVSGTAAPLPNDPHGGTIGANQYSTWSSNFGQFSGNGASSAFPASPSATDSAIPEPRTIALAAVGILLVPRYRRTAKNRC
jgi:hypothetical protein